MPERSGEPFELDRTQCLAFLASVGMGRVILAGPADGPAVVLPVNFVLDGAQVVVRTGEGTILAAARAGAWITFQADSGAEAATAWSVTAGGRAHEATGTALHHLLGLPLSPVAGGDRRHIVVVPVETVEGRRVGVPARSPVG